MRNQKNIDALHAFVVHTILAYEFIFFRYNSIIHFIQTGDSDARSKKSLSSLRCGWNYGIDVTNRRSKRRALFGGWQKENITYLIEKYSTKLSHQKVDKYIARAFDVWSQYTNLNFTAKKYWLVDIVIQFAENKHGVCQAFDGPGDVFGHASAPSRTYAYIHFDDAEDWSDERKFFEIAIHEIGHTLGLDHTSVSNSVMQKHYPFDLEGNSNLSLDDIEVSLNLSTISNDDLLTVI